MSEYLGDWKTSPRSSGILDLAESLGRQSRELARKKLWGTRFTCTSPELDELAAAFPLVAASVVTAFEDFLNCEGPGLFRAHRDAVLYAAAVLYDYRVGSVG